MDNEREANQGAVWRKVKEMTLNERIGLVTLEQEDWEARHRSPEWLTASMVSTICGFNEDESAFSLFHTLRGIGGKEPDADLRFRWDVGLHMESLLGERYARDTGRSVVQPSRCTVAIHDDLPYLMATPDLLVLKPNGKPALEDVGVGECKTTEVWTGDAQKWRDETPPLRVQTQVQAQLACTGLKWGSLIGMIGLGGFVTVDVKRNEDFIEGMLDCVAEFKERLERNDPPPVDGLPSTKKMLGLLHPEDDGTTTVLDHDEAQGNWELMREYKEQAEELLTKAEAHRNRLADMIGDHRVGLAGANKFTLATIHRSPKLIIKLDAEDMESDGDEHPKWRQIKDAIFDVFGVECALQETEPYRQLYPPRKWK